MAAMPVRAARNRRRGSRGMGQDMQDTAWRARAAEWESKGRRQQAGRSRPCASPLALCCPWAGPTSPFVCTGTLGSGRCGDGGGPVDAHQGATKGHRGPQRATEGHRGPRWGRGTHSPGSGSMRLGEAPTRRSTMATGPVKLRGPLKGDSAWHCWRLLGALFRVLQFFGPQRAFGSPRKDSHHPPGAWAFPALSARRQRQLQAAAAAGPTGLRTHARTYARAWCHAELRTCDDGPGTATACDDPARPHE